MSYPNNNQMVVKSNLLIESSTKLSLFEQRIVLFVISLIKKDDAEFKQYTIDIRTFRELAGIQQGYNFTAIKERLRDLLKKVVEIKDEYRHSDKKYLLSHWLSSASVDIDAGTIKVTVAPQLKPYLLQLKSHFTMYKLKYAISFSNKYSVRIYELLQQYLNYHVRTISVEQLKYSLGINPNEYKEYKNFKAKVLLPSQRDINDKSDIEFEYEELKQRNKVAGLKFRMQEKQKELIDKGFSDLLNLIPEEHRWKKSVKDALWQYYSNHYENDYIVRNITYANKRCRNNYTRYLQLSLDEDWGLVDWENQLQKEKELAEELKLKNLVEEKRKKEELLEQQKEDQLLKSVMEKYNNLSVDEQTKLIAIIDQKYRFLRNRPLETKLIVCHELCPRLLQ